MEAPWIFDGAFDPSQLIEAAADDMIDVWKKTQRQIHDHTQIPDWCHWGDLHPAEGNRWVVELLQTKVDVKSLDLTVIGFLMKLFNSANMDIIKNCLLHFKFSLTSELIRERKEKFVSKFACCHNLLWQFGIYFI